MKTTQYLDTDFIRLIMDDRSLDINSLASSMDMPPEKVRNVLSGSRSVTLDAVNRLAKALDLPIFCLFGEKAFRPQKKEEK